MNLLKPLVSVSKNDHGVKGAQGQGSLTPGISSIIFREINFTNIFEEAIFAKKLQVEIL